jgi:aspartokinase
MKERTKAILGLAKVEEKQIEAMEEKVVELAKQFLAKYPKAAQGWNQAVNARFADEMLPKEKEARLVFLHEVSNASALRQALEKKGLLTSVFDGLE